MDSASRLKDGTVEGSNPSGLTGILAVCGDFLFYEVLYIHSLGSNAIVVFMENVSLIYSGKVGSSAVVDGFPEIPGLQGSQKASLEIARLFCFYYF